MAQLWLQDADGNEWAVLPLIGSAYGIFGQDISLLDNSDFGRDGTPLSAMLVQCTNGPLPRWSLLSRTRASVHVNGSPLVLGVRLLCDRDEIVLRADGSPVALRCFFSAEQLAEVVAYPGGDGAVRCPRCKQLIERNEPAVRCPHASCGAWHHEDAARRLQCWTYGPTCALCDQPTQLDSGFRWTPENL